MRILLCSDGSPQAEQAVRIGAAIAALPPSEVTLLGISESPAESKGLLESLQRSQSFLAEKKIAAELITKTGQPIEEIVRLTREKVYDLVVIGAVRKQTRGAFWMSSKSYKITKEIEPPVLLVSGRSAAIQRILICSGGQRHIQAGIRLTGEIAQRVGASVRLLHVMAGLPGIMAQLPNMMEDTTVVLRSESELGVNLRNGLDLLKGMGVNAEAKLRRGDVLEEILLEIREGNYDIIVTGSALHHTFRTYVLGDISREIVNRSNRAVLIVRSQEPERDYSFFPRWFSKSKKT